MCRIVCQQPKSSLSQSEIQEGSGIAIDKCSRLSRILEFIEWFGGEKQGNRRFVG